MADDARAVAMPRAVANAGRATVVSMLITLGGLVGCSAEPRALLARGGAGGPADSAQLAACSNCHGTAASPAPPASTTGSTSTTDVAVGAHATHLSDGPLRLAVACTECHAAVADLTHIDGVARIAWGPLATAAGATPAWNRAGPAPSCATTYCHGATLAGGTNVNPVWTKVDGTQAACGACHGLPPPAPHPATTADCGACHVGYTATSVDRAKHIDGVVQVGSGGGGSTLVCGSCHAIPPPAPHTQSTLCGTCHTGYTSSSVNTALHQNGRVDVSADAACGSCHGIPPAAPHTPSTLCGTCHTGYTSSSVNVALHQNGTVDVISQSCTTCHGAPPSSGQHQRSEHRSRSCGDCHPGYTTTSVNATLHVNGTANVGNRITSWNPSTRTCTNSCHGSETW